MKAVEWHYVRGLTGPEADLAPIFQPIRGLSGNVLVVVDASFMSAPVILACRGPMNHGLVSSIVMCIAITM